MAKEKLPLRSQFSPWVAVSVMGEVFAGIIGGFPDLYRSDINNHTKTLIVGAMLERFATMIEALDVLIEAVPSLAHLRAENEAEFARFYRHRDDSAHIADRILRQSASGRHEAGFSIPGHPFTAQALMFDPSTSAVTIGDDQSQSIKLAEAIAFMNELYHAIKEKMEEENAAGRVVKPPNYKAPKPSLPGTFYGPAD